MTRVGITGIGLVTSIGSGRQRFWEALLAGVSGIRRVLSFDTSAYPVHIGAEIPDFSPENYLRRLNPATMGRASQFAVAAALLAINPAPAQTVIDDWSQIKIPPPPALKPVTLVAQETALLVMDFTVQTCTPERRKRCADSVPKVKKFVEAARQHGAHRRKPRDIDRRNHRDVLSTF